jgi:hypothetical protein
MIEADVKKKLRAYLKSVGAYQYWPVPFGLGATTLDVLVCYKGQMFGIECKRPGVEEATARQQCVMREIARAGGGVWVENDPELKTTKERIR